MTKNAIVCIMYVPIRWVNSVKHASHIATAIAVAATPAAATPAGPGLPAAAAAATPVAPSAGAAAARIDCRQLRMVSPHVLDVFVGAEGAERAAVDLEGNGIIAWMDTS